MEQHLGALRPIGFDLKGIQLSKLNFQPVCVPLHHPASLLERATPGQGDARGSVREQTENVSTGFAVADQQKGQGATCQGQGLGRAYQASRRAQEAV